MIELKPCPFCGVDPVSHRDIRVTGWVVKCDESECGYAEVFAYEEDSAIAQWNSRRPAPIGPSPEPACWVAEHRLGPPLSNHFKTYAEAIARVAHRDDHEDWRVFPLYRDLRAQPALPYVWTSQKPTMDAWYWYRARKDAPAFVGRFEIRDGSLQWFIQQVSMWVDVPELEYAGPIPEPLYRQPPAVIKDSLTTEPPGADAVREAAEIANRQAARARNQLKSVLKALRDEYKECDKVNSELFDLREMHSIQEGTPGDSERPAPIMDTSRNTVIFDRFEFPPPFKVTRPPAPSKFIPRTKKPPGDSEGA